MIWRIFGGLFAICVLLVAGRVVQRELKIRRLDAKIRADDRSFITHCGSTAQMIALYSLMHRNDKRQPQ
jgi:hypothetical protein